MFTQLYQRQHTARAAARALANNHARPVGRILIINHARAVSRALTNNHSRARWAGGSATTTPAP